MKGKQAYSLQWVLIDSKYWLLLNPSYDGPLPRKMTKELW